MAKFLALGPSDDFFNALVKHGVLPDGIASSVSRVVIDLQVGHPAMVYYSTFADNETLDAGLVAALTDEPILGGEGE